MIYSLFDNNDLENVSLLSSKYFIVLYSKKINYYIFLDINWIKIQFFKHVKLSTLSLKYPSYYFFMTIFKYRLLVFVLSIAFYLISF